MNPGSCPSIFLLTVVLRPWRPFRRLRPPGLPWPSWRATSTCSWPGRAIPARLGARRPGGSSLIGGS
eukprot:915426-Alexandrium_andersonii.AAC.1